MDPGAETVVLDISILHCLPLVKAEDVLLLLLIQYVKFTSMLLTTVHSVVDQLTDGRR